MKEEKNSKEKPLEEEVADLVPEEEEENPALLLKKLRSKLKTCEAERKEYLDNLQRSRADYINATKRSNLEKEEAALEGVGNILRDIFEVIESLETAMASDAFQKLPEDWKHGMEAVKSKVESLLRSNEVERIHPEIGVLFNPEEQVAVGSVETKDSELDQTVTQVLRDGFRRKGRILRPASVKIFNF
ncbi:MAG: nucleotide exchange factor GrpE [Patescibacteria group bacterium]